MNIFNSGRRNEKEMFAHKVLKNAVHTIDGRILAGWARSRTSEGLLFYLNHEHGITQWDHPEYIRIMDEILSINTVKYAAYRTACKLHHLQKRFKLKDVSLQCVASAFDSAGLRAPENSDILPVTEIERVILYIFRTTYKHQAVDFSLCADLLINMILNTFDENRSGHLQVLKCKIFLVVMCTGRLQEKYRYLFNQISDHNNCCTRRRLAKLLQSLASITELLSEQLSFGVSFVPPAVQSCFREVEGDIGVTEEYFLNWLMQEPQTLVWWTTLYRLTSAEYVCHDIKCSGCKQRPITGLRYQCLKCLNYNLCQDCFLHGRKSRSHKLSHPIQEYCHESTGKEWRRSVLQILRHKLKKTQHFQPRYLTIAPDSACSLRSLLQDTDLATNYSDNRVPQIPLQCVGRSHFVESDLMSRTICQSVDNLDTASTTGRSVSSSNETSHVGSEPLIIPSSPRHQIHSVIKHLEDGQRQLSNQLDSADKPHISPHLVEQHTAELQTQINKLKTILQNCSKYPAPSIDRLKTLPRMESTPVVGERSLHLSLSPIGIQCNPNDTAVLDNKENHFTETHHTQESADESHFETPTHFLKDRAILSTISNNCREDGHSFKAKEKLQSFTEINSSDLTFPSKTAMENCRETDCEVFGTRAGVVNALKSDADDTEIVEVKEELEKIIFQLEEIFPQVLKDDQRVGKQRGVILASCEIGDAIANYVERIPTVHNV